MLYTSEAIVLRNIRFSETSVIAKMYTREKGMLSFYIPGVYGKKPAVKPAYLQPMQILNLNFYHRENRNLHRIKEARAINIPAANTGRESLPAVSLFMAELIQKTVVEEEANSKMFDFFCQAIEKYNSSDFEKHTFVIYFMLGFSRYLGFYPVSNYSHENQYFNLPEGKFTPIFDGPSLSLDEKESSCLGMMIDAEAGGKARQAGVEFSAVELLRILIQYFSFHVPNFGKMKSLEILNLSFD